MNSRKNRKKKNTNNSSQFSSADDIAVFDLSRLIRYAASFRRDEVTHRKQAPELEPTGINSFVGFSPN